MRQNDFEFRGLTFRRIVVTGLLAAFFGLAVDAVIIYFLGFVDDPTFHCLIILIAAFGLIPIFAKRIKLLWKVSITGDLIEIYCNNGLKYQFAFSEIKKSQVHSSFQWSPAQAMRLKKIYADIEKEKRPKISIWQTRNPHLLLVRVKNSYESSKKKGRNWNRSLTITTEWEKFNISVDTSFSNDPGKSDILIFDDFFMILEKYAIKHKFEKVDLISSFAPSDFRKYYYLRK